ncbi:MAG: 3-deoxy-manno-octulosonate cytidylyltransferase [Armatimonadetes bacterium]|nr:3-deoxy-manno-octulosonate cytidylyltransferase [Armatimonadota bacterium]
MCGVEIVVVIPARMASSRCPGKPLLDLCGRPMVQWVFEAASRASVASKVVIATPDREIADAARSFGAEAILTSAGHRTGTDRVAEVARLLKADAFLNVQGDEPLIPPATVDACAAPLLDGRAEMASIYDWAAEDDENDPAVVKVVTDSEDRALYFSRSPIPFRQGADTDRAKKHVGVYAYTGAVLERFVSWEPAPLEKMERLEQLRFLENGVAIQMAHAEAGPVAVDTPEQAERVRQILSGRESK